MLLPRVVTHRVAFLCEGSPVRFSLRDVGHASRAAASPFVWIEKDQ